MRGSLSHRDGSRRRRRCREPKAKSPQPQVSLSKSGRDKIVELGGDPDEVLKQIKAGDL